MKTNNYKSKYTIKNYDGSFKQLSNFIKDAQNINLPSYEYSSSFLEWVHNINNIDQDLAIGAYVDNRLVAYLSVLPRYVRFLNTKLNSGVASFLFADKRHQGIFASRLLSDMYERLWRKKFDCVFYYILDGNKIKNVVHKYAQRIGARHVFIQTISYYMKKLDLHEFKDVKTIRQDKYVIEPISRNDFNRLFEFLKKTYSKYDMNIIMDEKITFNYFSNKKGKNTYLIKQGDIIKGVLHYYIVNIGKGEEKYPYAMLDILFINDMNKEILYSLFCQLTKRLWNMGIRFLLAAVVGDFQEDTLNYLGFRKTLRPIHLYATLMNNSLVFKGPYNLWMEVY